MPGQMESPPLIIADFSKLPNQSFDRSLPIICFSPLTLKRHIPIQFPDYKFYKFPFYRDQEILFLMNVLVRLDLKNMVGFHKFAKEGVIEFKIEIKGSFGFISFK